MAIDRQRLGLTVLRVCLGLFFLFEGLGKIRWFTSPSILAATFSEWSRSVPADSIAAWYLHRIAVPGVPIFARLVPLGELSAGVALLVGFWTPLFAFLAFFMVLNYQIASGAILQLSYLANRSGLPVLASTLALAIGGVRLPWSLRS